MSDWHDCGWCLSAPCKCGSFDATKTDARFIYDAFAAGLSFTHKSASGKGIDAKAKGEAE